MGCGTSKADAATGGVAAGSPPAAQTQKQPHAKEAEEEAHGEVDKDMWEGILSRIKPTMLKPGAIQSVIVIGAGASGLRCAALLKQKGITVTILEGRDRIGGRLYTNPDGLDIGGHWIHGGGPDDKVEMFAASKISPEQVNPVRQLCDEYGIATRLTDGDSCYIGESEAGAREIMFFDSDGTAIEDDGEAETELWDTYEMIMEKVWALEDEMVAAGKPGGSMSLLDAIEQVTAALETPLTARQKRFLQWHIETEFGGDYAEDAHNLSFFHYDGGKAGEYRVFPGGDRVLEGGYSSLITKMGEPLQQSVQLNKVVSKIDLGGGGGVGVAVSCADGSTHTADVCVCTLPLGVLQRAPAEAGHVAVSPPLPAEKQAALGRARMACLNKLFLVFDTCHWPADQYTFAYVNETPDEYPSMIVNIMPSHGLPILTCMVGGGAGRAMERRELSENVAWAMQLVRKLFGSNVPEPTRAVQTAWDQDPFSYGAYSCAGKGVHADDGFTIAEPVGGKLFFAGEHTNPLFWGCVHGAIVSGAREACRISGDEGLLRVYKRGGAQTQTKAKRAAKGEKVKAKSAAVKAKVVARVSA